MRKTLCALLAAAAMAVGCAGKPVPQLPRESMEESIKTAFILPYATGTKQLWFGRNDDGSFKPYIDARSFNVGPGLSGVGCLYAPGEGNEKYCAGKPNPTPISQIEFNELTTSLKRNAAMEYMMEGIDTRIGRPAPEK
ncbi:MAG: hypothetical protein V2A62_04160 [Candidatus Woesearchaeota archaeon]